MHESVGNHVPGVTTRPIAVALRESKDGVSKELPFALLYATKGHKRWNTSHYRAAYGNLADEYANRPGAKQHVVDRYERSREIIDAMLEGRRGEPGFTD